ncbi:MAG TPA: hypothetical protein PLS51_06695 [Flavobacterium sp.]|jgi:transposase-like protein|nr:hypothetical protein [Flavobacterium sp.]HPJ10301.1 hypothetical protein [Flavobacterium sp.]
MVNSTFNSSNEIFKAFPDEDACISHLEQLRWNGNIVSPFDSYSKVYPCKNNRYRCRNSGKYFNARTGTIFQSSRIPLQKWFLAIWIVTNRQKTSSVALAQDLELTQKTAWYMLQRIKKYLSEQGNTKPASRKTEKTKSQPPKTDAVRQPEKLPVLQWLQLLKK